MGTVPTTSPFEALAAELAASTGLLDALLATHRDDGTGHCQSCTTTPGYGTRDVPMPCPLGRLAEYADRLHPRRSGTMSTDPITTGLRPVRPPHNVRGTR